MDEWIRKRLESLLDNAIFSGIVAGGIAVWTAIKSLPLPVVVSVFVLIFVLLLVCLRIILRLWQHKNVNRNEVDLIIGAKVIDNPVLSIAQKMSNPRPYQGEQLKTVEVALQIQKPMTIDQLALDIWGQKLESDDFKEHTIVKQSGCSKMAFYIPDEYAKDNPVASIYILANSHEYHSEPFSIKFGE